MSNQISPPPVTVPYELIFDLPSSMLDSRKIEQRIQPYSQSQYTSAGQIAKFTIPQTDRTLASGQTMYLTGKLVLDGLSNTAASNYAILGSFYSMFSRQVVLANGTVWETIEKPGELVNLLINMTMNSSEKVSQSNSLGCASYQDEDSTSNIGLKIGMVSGLTTDTSTIVNKLKQTISFAIPIIGVLDANKYIPMWNSNIDLELTINALQNWFTAVETLAALTGSEIFTLSDLELVFDSIELSPESFNMVMSNYPQKVFIKSQSYLAGTGNVSSGISGGQDIPINARLSSMKQLFFYFNNSTNCADQTFGGINPNANDIVFITNGKYYPQRPIKCTNPSECYMQIQKSFGSIKTYSHSGCIGKNEFCRRDKVDTDKMYKTTQTSKTALGSRSDGTGGGNKFYLAIDTEIINTNKASLYNGIQTGVNSNIRVNIADPLTNGYTCFYWCCYDVLLEMDFTTGISRAIY